MSCGEELNNEMAKSKPTDNWKEFEYNLFHQYPEIYFKLQETISNIIIATFIETLNEDSSKACPTEEN